MGSELVKSSSPNTYGDTFRELCPTYLALGMSWDQYWNQDCTMVRYFVEAERIRKKRRNGDAWLQGAYFYEALCNVSPILHAFAQSGTKPIPYREKPFETEPEESPVKEEKLDTSATFGLFAKNYNHLRRKRGELDGD